MFFKWYNLKEAKKMKDFINYNKMEIINDGDIKVKVNITNETLNPFNIVHGGLTFSMGDTVMGIKLKELGRNAVTMNANINFISPGVGKYLIASAKIIKNGKHTCVMGATIKNDEDVLVSTMNGTYFYIN